MMKNVIISGTLLNVYNYWTFEGMKNCIKVKAVSKTKGPFKFNTLLDEILNIKVNANKKIEQILKQFLKKSKIAR